MASTLQNTYEIHTGGGPAVVVFRVPSMELANNGKASEENRTIRLHVSTDGDLWVVLTSSGDDQAVGWVDHRGIEFLDVAAEWFESFEGVGDFSEWLTNLVAATAS